MRFRIEALNQLFGGSSGATAGDAANNLSFTMAGFFLILYYTNVVGVEGAVIGTMRGWRP